MPQIIPVINNFRQTFTTVLGSQRVRFVIYYIESLLDTIESAWYVDLVLLSDQEEIIILGKRLQTFESISDNLATNLIGKIYVVPETAPAQDLNNESPWGITHLLIYFLESEATDVATVLAQRRRPDR